MTIKPMKKMIVAAILTSSVAMAGIAFANHHEEGRDDDGERGMRMVKMLNLNEEQTKKFQAMHPMNENRKEDRMAHRDLRKELHELAMQDKLDEKKMNQMADQIGADARAEAIQRSRAFHEFYVSLSEEQKIKFNAMHEMMQEKRGERFEKMQERKEKRHGDDHHNMH